MSENLELLQEALGSTFLQLLRLRQIAMNSKLFSDPSHCNMSNSTDPDQLGLLDIIQYNHEIYLLLDF
jgi:hypothetical protein